MPRYDLMHWSQRVRDQQAAYAPASPVAIVPEPRRAAKPRTARPKPPRDEQAEQLLRLCREGRLFELQEWVAAGKPLTMPAHYRRTPLRVALDTGFHSLIEFLLQHEDDQSTKDEVLRNACWTNQLSVMQLALKYGASISVVSFEDVIKTWDREVVRMFLGRGADPVTNAPFARAFKARVKSALGSFLDCTRARPDLAEALQQQADMALRQACQNEDLKWVSLLMWLGANPRTKGLATDDLESPDAQDDPEYQQSALQIACQSRKPEILKRLKPDPATDDLGELMRAAASFITTPETVAYLVSLGADVNDKQDGGSTVLDTCLRYAAERLWLGWSATSAAAVGCRRGAIGGHHSRAGRRDAPGWRGRDGNWNSSGSPCRSIAFCTSRFMAFRAPRSRSMPRRLEMVHLASKRMIRTRQLGARLRASLTSFFRAPRASVSSGLEETRSSRGKVIESTYGTLKPCLHGSDSHHASEITSVHADRYCWLKGDLTFETLRQVASTERGVATRAALQLGGVLPAQHR
jgi:hypothetical protein